MLEKFEYGFLNRVYGYDDYTQLEINSKLIQKIDEVIEECNNAFEFMDWLKEQGVPEEVQNIINGMLEDGTLENLINLNKLNELKNELKTQIETTTTNFNSILSKIMRYPLLEGVENEEDIKDYRYPYCHVHRYGGTNDGVTDNSKAIQLCVDITEKMAAKNLTLYPIRFESGVYIVKNTIKIKCGNVAEERNTTPITMLGYPTRYIDIELGQEGTIIRPQIPKHTNKNYSNLFAINIKYDSTDKNNELDIMNNTSLINSNIKINNMAFCLTDSEVYSGDYTNGYKVNAIKGYRFRTELKNIGTRNMNSLVLQPETDISNNKNVCDFSRYENINFINIIEYGLRLMECDNTKIIQLTNHRPQPTMKAIISINGGSGISIEQFHSAYHFINNTLTPRQDGSGKNGNKCYILLENCKSVKIDGTHIERCLADYFIICKNVQGLELKNHFERFLSNGLLRYDKNTSNVILENVCRNITLVDEYDDILCENLTEFTNKNITIKNFLRLNFYNEPISLAFTNYGSLTRDNNNTKKSMRFYTNEVIQQSLELPLRKFKVVYNADTSLFNVCNMDGSINTELTATYSEGILTIATTDTKRPFKILNVSCIYHSATPLIPYVIGNKIKFYSIETSSWTTNASAKSNCEILCGLV